MNKEKIIAINKKNLKYLIQEEINLYGNNYNLNHIDVSKITDMKELFKQSDFNGDISQWDVSHVTTMEFMFHQSQFNGDISQWNVCQFNIQY